MAQSGEAGSLLRGQIVKITECSICFESFKEPKVLPCIHTFCLHCLEKYGEKHNPGEKVNCPLCREEFTIPQGGFKKLPNNYFICQLMELSLTQKLIRGCKKHPSKEIEFYCYDCKTTACVMCFKETHMKHKIDDVNEAAKEFSKQMKEDIKKITPCILRNRNNLQKIEENKKSLISKVQTTKEEIIHKHDHLRSLLESHRNQLVTELDSYLTKCLKEFEARVDEVESQLLSLESFKRYCEEMEKNGTSCDISSDATTLHLRADELLNNQKTLMSMPLFPVDIVFAPSPASENLIGQVMFSSTMLQKKVDRLGPAKEDHFKLNSKSFLDNCSVDILKTDDDYVKLIAVVGDKVFVARHDAPTVEIFDSRNLAISGRLYIRSVSLSVCMSIAGCLHNNCLYVCSGGIVESKIERVDLSNNSNRKWIVAGKCVELSVTAKEHNLLMTIDSPGRLQEYTTKGRLIREIFLDLSIDEPLHCVQLSTGNFVVSHAGSTQHRVCIVDTSGHILNSYGGSPGLGIGHLSDPSQLSVDSNDHVFVIDCNNHRIQLLSPKLTHLGNIQTPGYQLKRPAVVELDQVNRRLYVGEWNGRVLVIKA